MIDISEISIPVEIYQQLEHDKRKIPNQTQIVVILVIQIVPFDGFFCFFNCGISQSINRKIPT